MEFNGLTHGTVKQGIVSKERLPVDSDSLFVNLRPRYLKDYIGQREIVETLKIAIQAAIQRKEPLDHIIFHGPPGLGKTTLANIIANEMNASFTVTSGPALEKGGDLLGILTHLEEGGVLFVDEIHRTPKAVEEFLYPAMEDFAVDFIFDKGVHARSHRFQLKRFTLVGATTRVGLLSAPLRDRFGLFKNLEFYNYDDMLQITRRSAGLLNAAIDDGGAEELAKRSRGTPRILNRLLKRVRDYAQVRSDGVISKANVEAALALEGVDHCGLTRLDRRYLDTIIRYYGCGPVGIEAIAATLQEEVDTLVDVVEPYLLSLGFVIRSSAGRKASENACSHLTPANG